MSIELTVLSTADDKFFSNVERNFYFDDDQALPNPGLPRQFIVTSRWRDANQLDRKLYAIGRLAGSTGEVIGRLDLVGHAIFKAAGSTEVVGMAMDDDRSSPSIGLDGTGELIGLDVFKTAWSYCTKDVKLRMLLCEADELPAGLLDKLLAELTANRPDAELWVTTKANSESNFGLGGFSTNDPELLIRWPRGSALRWAERSAAPVRSPSLRDGCD